MTTKHSLAVLVSLTCLSLVRCYGVLITTRRGKYDGDTKLINIRFTSQWFKNLYEGLCKVTTQQCSVQVWSSLFRTYCTSTSNPIEERQENLDDDPACKYYQCHYRWNISRFVCTQEASVSCQSSSRAQSIRYRDADCSDVSCVGITWRFPDEKLDYSDVQGTVDSCNRDCECSTGVVATPAVESSTMPPTRNATVSTTPIRTTKRTTTRKPTVTTKKATTTTTKLKTTITTKTTPKRTVLTTVTLTPSQEMTSQRVNPTTEANTTALGRVSDSHTQNDPVPIIAGVVVASLVVAFIAAVSVFLWKRRNLKAAESDCHEYANLPEASVVAQKSNATTKVVDLNQDSTSQYINYDTVNGSFDYDQGEVKYDSPTNQLYGNIAAKVHADNQHYVNYEPNRSHTVAPVDGNQTKDTNLKNKDGYVTVTNTLEETDDFTTSIYSLAAHNNPEHLASVSGSNTETNFRNFHPQNSTDHPHLNTTAAIETNTFHTFNETDIKNYAEYSLGNTHDYAKPTVSLHSLDKSTYSLQDYDFAKQTKGPISNDDYGYSLSNCDSNPNTTYSIASNPVNNMDKTIASDPHVYSKLGKDNHKMVNPYDALQETNEAPVPNQVNILNNMDKAISSHPHVYSKLGKDNHIIVNPYDDLQQANESSVHGQANSKQFNHGKLPDQMDLYSVAEPLPEDPPQEDNDYSY